MFIVPKLDKDQLHPRKPTSKSNSSVGRASTSKATGATQSHEHSPKHSAMSTPKQQSYKARSSSSHSDSSQTPSQVKAKRSPSIPLVQLPSPTSMINIVYRAFLVIFFLF